MEVQFIKSHEDAKLPVRHHEDVKEGDAGFDVFCVEDILVPANGSIEVKTGLKLAYITPGYWIKIEGRSGLGFNHGISPHFGVIDNGYRGIIGVKLYNATNDDYTIEKGRAVAQLLVSLMIPCEMTFVEESREGSRGENGFGSSDKN